MRVTVVGTGTAVPNLERRQSSVVVESGGEVLVFDLGSGAVRGMLRAGLDPLSLDHIFFTHFHPDHTVDIVPLLFALKYGTTEPRTKPLTITGPQPFTEFYARITSVWGEWMTGDYPTDISELPQRCPSPIELAGLSITWASAEHRPESIAYRLESEGTSFVYTGDTEYSLSVVELAQDADTLLIECSSSDGKPVPGHLTPSSVARIATEARARRVVLTHMYPPAEALDLVSEVGRGFDGEVIVAHDGLKLDF